VDEEAPSRLIYLLTVWILVKEVRVVDIEMEVHHDPAILDSIVTRAALTSVLIE
jgi:hypothetical protein